ncbi:putative Sigma-70 region 4 type 2 [uncultured Sporomusa sp.]|uniref:Putative Sigma-70 region 4 type 2 n=1 Tax=uncultured Sporomusa sp. TaxID=307249 RepID=A0A212LZZ0_9FIRM|nr:hypothetical protein [uncultured Sporomusa sp.]SCM83175.1 putative Sigma-70 region 4 type 2 [uncultured Sporomusa sp.]
MNQYCDDRQASTNEYTVEQITSIIKHYDELYSIVQVTAVNFDKIRSASAINTKEDILCTLVDVDQSIAILSPLQQKILNMLKSGHNSSEICLDLQLNTARLKYTMKRALVFITNYLNADKTAKVRNTGR